jgi:hypothetical protein
MIAAVFNSGVRIGVNYIVLFNNSLTNQSWAALRLPSP